MPMISSQVKLVISCYREKYRIQRDIDEKKLELMRIHHELSGLSHHGVEMTPEQAKSDLPMPKTVSPASSDARKLGLLERKDELEQDIDFLTISLQMARKVDQMEPADQSMMHDLYHSRKTADAVAEGYGYTRKGMYKHIYHELGKFC